MYQVTFSIGTDCANWFYSVEDKLKKDLDGRAVMVTRSEPSRLFVAVACENQFKRKVLDTLSEALIDMYALHAKRHYFLENLSLPMIGEEKFKILLAALVEFDSLSDRQLIRQTVSLESGLNIDGVYNFAFADVKNRWRDIGELTKENALYLTDNEIFFELIKYMFSAIAPKTESVLLNFDAGKYTLTDCGNGQLIQQVDSEEELLCALISVAPVSLEFSEGINSGLRQKLQAIFGVKPIKMTNLLS